MQQLGVNKFIGKVYHGDAYDLVRQLPDESIHSVLIDPMYGVCKNPKPYDWGADLCRGDPDVWWEYHGKIYQQLRRVLKRNGTLAMAMGCKFRGRFQEWFGGYRIWSLTRFHLHGLNPFGHIWVVQTKEQEPIRFPDADGLIICSNKRELLKRHPCPKTVEEMMFLVQHLSEPGQIILDCFAGTGTTLVAAARLGREWLGCDLSRTYCQIAMKRLLDLKSEVA